jgi:hypothetical protein
VQKWHGEKETSSGKFGPWKNVKGGGVRRRQNKDDPPFKVAQLKGRSYEGPSVEQGRRNKDQE